MLELAPLFWAQTRAGLDLVALAQELGPICIPARPLDHTSTAHQQPTPD